jgi:hypothetical protein
MRPRLKALRSGHLYRMGRKIDQIVRHLDRDISTERILQTRATFQRTETLVADAKRNVTIIGINLQAATDAQPSVLELARQRVVIWLRRNSDLEWFTRYLDQCHACFDGAREW